MKSDTPNADRIPLFLHIPKTAGTTLTNCLYRERKADDYYESEEGRLVDGLYYYPGGFHKESNALISAEAIRALERDDIRAVVGHFSFGIHTHINRPWTYVTLLRNPVDRILSLYHSCCAYHLPTDDGTQPRTLGSARLSIEDFVLNVSCREADNDQTRRISGSEPAFGACSTSTLDTAKNNLRRYFSVVGVTEAFDETLILLKRTLGWDKVPCYLPSLVNKDKPASAALPQKSINAILERNELDIRLHEFAKDLLYERIAQQPHFDSELRRFQALNAEYVAQKASQIDGKATTQGIDALMSYPCVGPHRRV